MTQRNVPHTKAMELAKDAGTTAHLMQPFDTDQASDAAGRKHIPHGLGTVGMTKD
jgi:hypothetical protein